MTTRARFARRRAFARRLTQNVWERIVLSTSLSEAFVKPKPMPASTVVSHREQIMLLALAALKVTQLTEISVMFHRQSERRRSVVGKAQRRREIKVGKPVERGVEDGIHDQVPGT